MNIKMVVEYMLREIFPSAYLYLALNNSITTLYYATGYHGRKGIDFFLTYYSDSILR